MYHDVIAGLRVSDKVDADILSESAGLALCQ